MSILSTETLKAQKEAVLLRKNKALIHDDAIIYSSSSNIIERP